MKITAYQLNAQMLKETTKVIEQQHLKELQRLNHQKEHLIKNQQFHQQWVSAAHVDVMV